MRDCNFPQTIINEHFVFLGEIVPIYPIDPNVMLEKAKQFTVVCRKHKHTGSSVESDLVRKNDLSIGSKQCNVTSGAVRSGLTNGEQLSVIRKRGGAQYSPIPYISDKLSSSSIPETHHIRTDLFRLTPGAPRAGVHRMRNHIRLFQLS